MHIYIAEISQFDCTTASLNDFESGPEPKELHGNFTTRLPRMWICLTTYFDYFGSFIAYFLWTTRTMLLWMCFSLFCRIDSIVHRFVMETRNSITASSSLDQTIKISWKLQNILIVLKWTRMHLFVKFLAAHVRACYSIVITNVLLLWMFIALFNRKADYRFEMKTWEQWKLMLKTTRLAPTFSLIRATVPYTMSKKDNEPKPITSSSTCSLQKTNLSLKFSCVVTVHCQLIGFGYIIQW